MYELATMGFSALYQVRASSQGIGSPSAKSFSLARAKADHEGLLIEVEPIGAAPWVGNFARGDGALDWICATPDPERICVVASGACYIVPVKQPDEYDVVSGPIVDVKSAPRQGLLLLVGFVDIVAFDRDHIQWRTGQISYDGIEIGDLSADRVRGVGWHAPSGEWREFSVHLNTGEHDGGAFP